MYSCLLKNEVLGYQFEDYKDVTEKKLTPNRKLFHVSGENMICGWCMCSEINGVFFYSMTRRNDPWS